MKTVKDLGPLWHLLGGAAITAAVVVIGVPWFIALLGVSLAGWAREVWQHDLRLTLWQWIEAVSWGIGSAVALGLLGLA